VAVESEKKVELVNGKDFVQAMFDHDLGISKRPLLAYDIEEEFFAR
jgi:hypothetical protein